MPRRLPIAALALAATTLLAGTAALSNDSAGAQTPRLADQRERLRQAKNDADRAEARSRALRAAAAKERDEAARARAEQAAMAARIEAAQSDIVAAQARVAILGTLLRTEHARLAERQAPVARLVAALQSFARRPAVIGLVQPGSTDDMVHVRAALGAIAPVVAERTADVRAEVARAQGLRQRAALAVASLSDSRRRLEDSRVELAKLEAAHRLRSRDLGRSALVESDRAIALGERSREIVDLMGTLDRAAVTAKDLATLPGPLPRPDVDDAAAPDRPRSASPDSHRPPPYRLPVAGRLVTGLGEVSDSGVRSRGLTFAAPARSVAVAPAAGKIAYAAPFRRYGRIVIIDHGQGWTTLITHLGDLSVKVGDRVRQGEVLGRTEDGEAPHVSVELRRRGQPFDMTPLLG